MSGNAGRSIAGHAIVMGLIAWSMFAAVGAAVGGGLVVRLLALVWIALGAWLLVRRWRSAP